MVNSKVTGKGDSWIVTEKLIVDGMERIEKLCEKFKLWKA